MIAGVILAAGASRRMGRPKALLTLGAECFLDRLIGVLGSVCQPVIVVLGHQEEAIRAGITRNAVFVRNSDPDRGQITSLQAALSVVPAEAGSVMFTPVDYPAVALSTVERLAEARGMAPVVQPEYMGRRGHPVLISRTVAEEILALPETAQARDVLRAHARVTIPVDDPGVIADIDEPADYERLLERTA